MACLLIKIIFNYNVQQHHSQRADQSTIWICAKDEVAAQEGSTGNFRIFISLMTVLCSTSTVPPSSWRCLDNRDCTTRYRMPRRFSDLWRSTWEILGRLGITTILVESCARHNVDHQSAYATSSTQLDNSSQVLTVIQAAVEQSHSISICFSITCTLNSLSNLHASGG